MKDITKFCEQNISETKLETNVLEDTMKKQNKTKTKQKTIIILIYLRFVYKLKGSLKNSNGCTNSREYNRASCKNSLQPIRVCVCVCVCVCMCVCSTRMLFMCF